MKAKRLKYIVKLFITYTIILVGVLYFILVPWDLLDQIIFFVMLSPMVLYFLHKVWDNKPSRGGSTPLS